jgi:cobyrinic acid a,c-diamide synthase
MSAPTRHGIPLESCCPRLVVAAPQSGAGKTSVSLGLVASLASRGLRVQTFKVGPDFLDPTYLALASGRPCYNLDGWMSGHDYVRERFALATADADIAIIEGVMGMFDGANATRSEGSTAEIARWLDAPVLLVIDAHGLARTVAPLVKGLQDFDPEVRLGGVIANQVGSSRHTHLLAEALRSAGGPPLLGGIPQGGLPALPSRHLGLHTADSKVLPAQSIAALAEATRTNVELEPLLQMAGTASPLTACRSLPEPRPVVARLGVARDEAFHFYYPDNLEALQAAGCELVEFSPLHDRSPPAGLDGVYLGGGYPEEHAVRLAENRSMLEALRQFAATGGAIYAECGGLVYLCSGLETLDGERHDLLGLLPATAFMHGRHRRLGYVEVETCAPTPWGPPGTRLRGHEFHYTELGVDPLKDGPWHAAYRISNRRDRSPRHEGYQRGRVLTSYVHLHFGANPNIAAAFATYIAGLASNSESIREKGESQ